MSDLRFIDELGAEFRRVAEHPSAGRKRRGPELPRRVAPALGYAIGVLAVVAVLVAVVVVKAGGSHPASGGGSQVSVTFHARPLNPGVQLASALQRSTAILRDRLDAVFKDVQISQSGSSVTVTVPSSGRASSDTRARVIALSSPGVLAFYDWEADALTPSGKSVASLLGSQDPSALTISQGSGSAPGGVGAGCFSLAEARQLASKHRGTVVLRAVPPTLSESTLGQGTAAGFFVLEDRPALTGAEITHPVRTTDPAGQPAVDFGFTNVGGRAFQHLTALLARRGTEVSGLGQTFSQHFAIAIDHQLITVPSIDFKVYPEGIPPRNGADITGPFTPRSANDLVILLRYGALGVRLTPDTAGHAATGP